MIKNGLNKKIFSSGILLILTANLIVGGILLPQKEIRAQGVDAIGGPSQILSTIEEYIHDAWDYVAESYHSAASWISANIGTATWLEGKLQTALKTAWMILRKKLLDMVVDDIIKWIQGGGKPQFVTDWKGFLSKAANDAGGDFVSKYLGMGFLCKPFDVQLRLVLAGSKNFNQRAQCTLADMGNNLQNFYNNFSNGGWATWISITEPQNNFYGAYFMAMDEKYAAQAAAADAAKNEAIASAGFLGDKVCKLRSCGDGTGNTWYESDTAGWKADQMNPNDLTSCSCEQWETRTPGKIAADSLSKAVNIDIDWLISAKEFQEYAAAIIDAAINRVIKEGVSAMQTSGGSSGQSGAGITIPAYVSVDISPYTDASANKPIAAALIDQEKLLKENLQKTITEQQTNLGILSQIKTAQAGALKVLNQFDTSKCAVPVTLAEYNKQIADNDAAITQLTNQIADNQTQLNNLSNAILEMTAYQKAATDYTAAYDAAQYSANADQAGLTAAERTMKNAKNKALASTQAILQTQETDFNKLLQAIQGASMSVVQQSNDAQTKRGFGQCSYTPASTLYATSCNAQTQQTSFQTALSTCLTTWAIQQNTSGP